LKLGVASIGANDGCDVTGARTVAGARGRNEAGRGLMSRVFMSGIQYSNGRWRRNA
jgi:hypothetical protein